MTWLAGIADEADRITSGIIAVVIGYLVFGVAVLVGIYSARITKVRAFK